MLEQPPIAIRLISQPTGHPSGSFIHPQTHTKPPRCRLTEPPRDGNRTRVSTTRLPRLVRIRILQCATGTTKKTLLEKATHCNERFQVNRFSDICLCLCLAYIQPERSSTTYEKDIHNGHTQRIDSRDAISDMSLSLPCFATN